MTLLSIVQTTCDIVGVGRPSTVVGSTNATSRTMLALANQGGLDLCRQGEWRLLTSEHTFSTVADSAQGSSALPSDFGRFVNGTIWNRSQRWQIEEIDEQDWAAIKGAGQVLTTVNQILLRGTAVYMTPVPTAGETIGYAYVTNQFCASSGGSAQVAWAADTDVGRLDESLLQLDLVWRWKQARGLDYAEDMQSFELRKLALLGGDKPRPTLNMGRTRFGFRDNVPEGSFPSS